MLSLYSAIVKAKAADQPIPEYIESDWAVSAEYALQAAKNFVNNVQETSLTGEASPKKPVKPANWVPDNTCSACMECEATFTFLFRRHHCRRCGRTVCGLCAPSKNTRPIPEWGYTDAVRHCKACYKSPSLEWA